MLTAENITVRLGGQTIVDNTSLTLAEGQWLMLCGPNGAGKSTLVGALSQSIPSTGRIMLNGHDVRRMRPVQLARQLGVLSQHSRVTYAFTVEEVVALGRYAWRGGMLGGGDKDGQAKVEDALRIVGLTNKRQQSMLTLSGGERQRAFLAQVLCQDPAVMLLDEPSNHLDLKHQQELFTLIDAWRNQPGRAVISVVHDLSLARRFGTHALLLDHGRTVSSGPCTAVLTPGHLAAVWHMDVVGWMKEQYNAWNGDNDAAGG